MTALTRIVHNVVSGSSRSPHGSSKSQRARRSSSQLWLTINRSCGMQMRALSSG